MPEKGNTMAERMATVEAWVSGHEALCAERYVGLKADLRWLIRGMFGMLIALVAWLAVQLWNGRNNTSPPPVTVMQTQAPAAPAKPTT